MRPAAAPPPAWPNAPAVLAQAVAARAARSADGGVGRDALALTGVALLALAAAGAGVLARAAKGVRT
ncbi:MAG TPA: hypothetical protein VLA98_07445 [Solirubrobacteraceae bacterium]|nr:hypothetical protein [Solirubrobacteraceae bacterium]